MKRAIRNEQKDSQIECTIAINKHRKICDVLCDLVLFVQFKKREKHPWRSVTFSKVANFFLNCKIDTKSRNASHIHWPQVAKITPL